MIKKDFFKSKIVLVSSVVLLLILCISGVVFFNSSNKLSFFNDSSTTKAWNSYAKSHGLFTSETPIDKGKVIQMHKTKEGHELPSLVSSYSRQEEKGFVRWIVTVNLGELTYDQGAQFILDSLSFDKGLQEHVQGQVLDFMKDKYDKSGEEKETPIINIDYKNLSSASVRYESSVKGLMFSFNLNLR